MAYNNTYGIQAINQSAYQESLDNFNRPGTGCKALILECQQLATEGDPQATGNNDTVNEACSRANVYCSNNVESPYIETSGRNYYDIASIDPTPFPPNYYLGYLANNYVQAALGVPVNYTQSTNGVYEAFNDIGDYARTDIRGGQVQDIAYLLDNGIKVAFLYGDRDYACNCMSFFAIPYPITINRDTKYTDPNQGSALKPSLSKSPTPVAPLSIPPVTPPSKPMPPTPAASFASTATSPSPASSKPVTKSLPTNPRPHTASSTVPSSAKISQQVTSPSPLQKTRIILQRDRVIV